MFLVLSSNSCLNLPCKSQRDSRSGIRFSLPEMCLTLISKLLIAAIKHISLKQDCRNLFFEAPVFMTRTVTKLSQLITIFFPEKLLHHAFKATTTVSISHILICRFSLNMKSRNEQ